MSLPRLTEFLADQAVRVQLDFQDTPNLIELHPVFTHLSVLLIQALGENGHGEFFARSRQGKTEAIIDLGGSINYRYHLNKEELEQIQVLYDEIVKTWITWKLSSYK
jgi:hypothetical protein